ncbi:hypothetical protein BH20CHL6_BH20CHL6_12700 [soil metagenome]|jgi:hypothetical protein
MGERLRVPGPSFAREETVELRSLRGTAAARRVKLGMSPPTATDDGWWLALLWAHEGGRVVDALDIVPAAGPPPGQPLLTLGPAFAGALAGLVAQEDGRQALRLRLQPAADESRPWERPLVLQLAVKWDAVRGLAMRPNELAREVLRAFGHAIQAAGRPG